MVLVQILRHTAQPGPGDRLIVSWDTAMSSNQPSDFSVCVVLLVHGETVYILDVIRARSNILI